METINLVNHFGEGMTLTRTLPTMPGVRLHFRFRLYLSEEFANRREASIGATPEEKAALMRGFKTGIIADTLIAPPTADKDTAIMGTIQPVQIEFPPESLPENPTPEQRAADLRRRAIEFFEARDASGNQVLWFLVESLFQEYWERALPDTFLKPSPGNGAAANVPSKETPGAPAGI